MLYVELIGSWHGQELQAQVVIADKTFPSIFIAPFKSAFSRAWPLRLYLECLSSTAGNSDIRLNITYALKVMLLNATLRGQCCQVKKHFHWVVK